MKLNLHFFLAAIAPLFAYGLIELLTRNMANANLNTILPDLTNQPDYYENATRHWVFAAGTLFGFLVVVTIAFCVHEIFSAAQSDPGTDENDPKDAWLAAGFAALLAAATYLSAIGFGSLAGRSRIVEVLGLNLFTTVLNSCVTMLHQPETCTFGLFHDGAMPEGFPNVLEWNLLLSSLGLATASVGCSLALCQSAVALRRRKRDEIFRLPKLFLRLSSAMFTASVLSLYAWTSWPIPFLSDGDAAAYRALQTAQAIFYGIAISVIILSFYGPTVAVLDYRLRRLHRNDEVVASEGEVASDGEEDTTSALIERSLTFLSPLITAMVSALAASFLSG